MDAGETRCFLKALKGKNLTLSTYEELHHYWLATKGCEQYLSGQESEIRTDHQSLACLLRQRLGAGLQGK